MTTYRPGDHHGGRRGFLMNTYENTFPDDTPGDLCAWRLTPLQAAHHHVRLAELRARQARHYADTECRYARRANITSRIVLVLIAAVLVLTAIDLVTP